MEEGNRYQSGRRVEVSTGRVESHVRAGVCLLQTCPSPSKDMTDKCDRDLGPRLGRGNIINIASMYGLVGTPMHITATSYAASKHAVIGLTKSDANQYAAHKIRINAMCPGYIATPLLLNAVKAGAMESEMAKVPLGRLGDVEEIGDACVWLASSMGSYVTGSSIVVDGGYTAN